MLSGPRVLNASTVFRRLAEVIDKSHDRINLADPNYEVLRELLRAARWYAKEKLGQDIAPGFTDEITHLPRIYQ